MGARDVNDTVTYTAEKNPETIGRTEGGNLTSLPWELAGMQAAYPKFGRR